MTRRWLRTNGTARRVVAASMVAFLAGLVAPVVGTAAAEPGVPSDPIVVYGEDFENNPQARPIKVNNYVGATGRPTPPTRRG